MRDARRTPLRHDAPRVPFVPFPPQRPTSRLRIGLLCRAYPPAPGGGIATYTQELAFGLHALGHEVHVFTEWREPVRREGVRLFVHGLAPDPAPMMRAFPRVDRQLRWAVAVARRILDLAREGTVLDVVESPNWEAEGLAIRHVGAFPIVVRLHSPLTAVAEMHAFPPSPDLADAIALERWLIASADGVTSSTAAVVNTVRDTMSIDPARITRYARSRSGYGQSARPRSPPRSRPGSYSSAGSNPAKGSRRCRCAAVHPRAPSRRARRSRRRRRPNGAARKDRPAALEARHRRAAWRRRCNFTAW
jgi:hypothetical protein